MSWIWHHGFETGHAYDAYLNAIATGGAYGASGWRVTDDGSGNYPDFASTVVHSAGSATGGASSKYSLKLDRTNQTVGPQSIRMSSGGTAQSFQSFTVSFAFRADGNVSTANDPLCIIRTTADGTAPGPSLMPIATSTGDYALGISLNNTGSGATGKTVPTPLEKGKWYWITFGAYQYLTTRYYRLAINGVTEHKRTDSGSAATWETFEFGWPGTSSIQNFYIDDVVVHNESEIFADVNSSFDDPTNLDHYIFGLPTQRIVNRGSFQDQASTATDAAVLTALTTINTTTSADCLDRSTNSIKVNVKPASAVINTDYTPPTIVAVNACAPITGYASSTTVGVSLTRDGSQKAASGEYGVSTQTEAYGGTTSAILMQVIPYGSGWLGTDVIELSDIDHANLVVDVTFVGGSGPFSTDLNHLYSVTSEVLWNKKRRALKASTRTDTSPKSALIFQDSELLKDNKYDTTVTVGYSFTQRGPYAGSSYPDPTNDGNMLAFLQGTWIEDQGPTVYRTPQDLNFRIAKSGGFLEGSEWLWGFKEFPANPSASFYMGYDDPKLPWVAYEPFAEGTSALGAGGGVGKFLEVAYSSKYDRVLFYRLRSDQIEIAYKNNSMYGTYDSGYESVFSFAKLSLLANRNLETSGTNVINYMADISNTWGLSIVETEDGVMHMFIGYFTKVANNTSVYASSYRDIARYTSVDGGLNWLFEEDEILLNYFEGARTCDAFQVAVSGNWFYLGFVDVGLSENEKGFYALASSNRGASWTNVYGVDTSTGNQNPNVNIGEKKGVPGNISSTAIADSAKVFSICGSPAGDGTFIMYAAHWGQNPTAATGNRSVAVFTAFRDSKMQKASSAVSAQYIGADYTIKENLLMTQAFCAIAGPSDVFVFGNSYLPGYDASSGVLTDMGWYGLTSRIIPVDRLEDISVYKTTGSPNYNVTHRTAGSWGSYSNSEHRDYLGMNRSQAYTPCFIRGVWAGDRIITGHCAYDSVDTNTVMNGTRAQEWGGWSYRPLRAEHDWRASFPQGMAAKYWNASMGCPAGSATASTMPVSQGFSDTKVDLGVNPSTIEIDNADLKLEITGSLDAAGNRSYLSANFAKNAVPGLTQSIGSRGLIAWTVNLSQMPDGLSPASPAWGGLKATSSYQMDDNGPITGVTARIINSFNGSAGVTRQSMVTVDIVRSGSNYVFHLYDTVAGTSLYALTKGTYDATMDCRLALYDDQHRNNAAGTTNQYCELIVGLHGARYPQWVSSGMLTLSQETAHYTEMEKVNFGNLGIGPSVTASTPVVSEWSQFLVSRLNQGGSLSQAGFNETSNNRGFPCAPWGQHLAQGVKARWGGNSAMVRDTYTGKIDFQYGIDRLPLASKKYEWRSNNLGGGSTETLAWRAGQASNDGYMHSFVHRAFSVWGANTRNMTLSYQYPGASTSFSIDFTEYTSSIVSLGDQGAAGTNNTKLSFSVPYNDAAKWRENELAGKYVDIEALNGNKTSYKISGNRGNWIAISGLNTLMQNAVSVLSTLHIYSGNKTFFFDEDMEYNEMTLAMTSGGTTATNPNPPEGYFKISNIVAGLTLPFTVPMDWAMNDAQSGNVVLYNAKSGVRTAYKQGDPRRVVTGKVVGDVSRWRDSFRSMVSEVAGYSENPMVLCLDTSSPTDSNTMYCRFMSNTNNQNVGWAYDENTSKWYQVGDVAVKFEEEI